MTAPAAITDAELAPLFAGLERYDLVVLAVSGGADSTALMHLVTRWRVGLARGPQLHVATVDHGLRAASRSEAAAVAIAARDLGLPHHRLTWSGHKPLTGLQEAARAARYELLEDLLNRLGQANAALVTAHTADDQAETLLMRLARGSGVDGLAAMAASRPLVRGGPLPLLRPLLGLSRQRLLVTLEARGIAWADDPSNANAAFERVRLRAAAPALESLGLTGKALAASAARLQRARAALDWATSALETGVLDVHAGAYAAIDRAVFAAAPFELRQRLLARVLARFGGASRPARLARIEALVHRLAAGSALTATLGGCVVAATASAVRVFREPGRHGLPECVIGAGTRLRWDERFLVVADGEAQQPMSVRALGMAAYAGLRDGVDRPLPARAAATLPAFWSGGELLAVPLLRLKPGLLPAADGLGLRTDFLGLPDDTLICD
jgi:tRNA(Ile)-lysidine synthase